METQALINDLQRSVEGQLARCEELRSIPVQLLKRRPDPKRWSVLEVIQHMNLSSGIYYRGLRDLYADPKSGLHLSTEYIPGRWGDLSTKAMRPGSDGRISWKMRTMGMFEPRTAHTEGLAALDGFVGMLKGFLELLELARAKGLEGGKVTSSLGPILRFKAGDAFRFPIAHQERHMLQVERTLKAVLEASG
jgi:hypothetical protein